MIAAVAFAAVAVVTALLSCSGLHTLCIEAEGKDAYSHGEQNRQRGMLKD